MNSIFDKGECEPCPNEFNLAAYVLSPANLTPNKSALSIISHNDTENWTFASLKAAVLGTASGLIDTGIVPGDKLMLRLGNTVDVPIAFLAAIAAGIHPIPLSSELTDVELKKLCSVVSPTAVCIDPALGFPNINNDFISISLEKLTSMRDMKPSHFQMGSPNRLAFLIFTSGTSNSPKAVMHAHRAVWARRMMVRDWYDLNKNDRLLHAGAFNWTFTLGTGLLDPWSLGATALVPKKDTSIKSLPKLLAKHSATIFAAAPGVYRKILQYDKFPHAPYLRHGLSAGEKLSDDLQKIWKNKTSTNIYEAFGMSECSTFISSSPILPARPGTIGRPQSGRCVAILPRLKGTKPVKLGKIGIISVHRRDPGLLLGYLGPTAASDEIFRGDWFVTGDLGKMDSDGSITYMGRNDDLITAGGFRVSPLEVETHLQSHPDIDLVAVKEVAIKANTRVIAAFYTAKKEIEVQILKKFAAKKLARYKQPRLFVYCDSLPTGSNGKLLRRLLSLPKD